MYKNQNILKEKEPNKIYRKEVEMAEKRNDNSLRLWKIAGGFF